MWAGGIAPECGSWAVGGGALRESCLKSFDNFLRLFEILATLKNDLGWWLFLGDRKALARQPREHREGFKP